MVNKDPRRILLDQGTRANYISAYGNQLSFLLHATLHAELDGFQLS
jgi:hypothetical protein